MSLYCQACGHTLESVANFCPSCGAKQNGSPAPSSTLGATIAKGAAIGAVAALPIPFVGPITGAIVGAGIAAYTKLSKD